MFRSLLRRLAIRASIVFLMIHAGLVFAVYGLASLPRTDETATAWWILAGGVGALYGAMLLSAFFVIWPLFTLARKVRQILRWKEWLLKELPAIIALIPTFVQAMREAFAPLAQSMRPAQSAPQSAGPPAPSPVSAEPHAETHAENQVETPSHAA